MKCSTAEIFFVLLAAVRSARGKSTSAVAGRQSPGSNAWFKVVLLIAAAVSVTTVDNVSEKMLLCGSVEGLSNHYSIRVVRRQRFTDEDLEVTAEMKIMSGRVSPHSRAGKVTYVLIAKPKNANRMPTQSLDRTALSHSFRPAPTAVLYQKKVKEMNATRN
ncbi:hypothetical protein J6590_044386 [Homalodisca vitripennis]|nr:hypothetical protein J6590_044386 [Homalodisca vitripennis]